MTTVAVAGDGVALLYCAIILLVLSWITFLMRVGVRLWRKVRNFHVRTAREAYPDFVHLELGMGS
jgi:hypothetical protein